MRIRVHPFILSWLGFSGLAHAATYNWNGGTADWDTSTANWNGAGTIWPGSGTDNDAVFGGSVGTITLTTGVAANDITFNTTGYLIQGNTLTLNGGATPVLSAGTGIDATISSIRLKPAIRRREPFMPVIARLIAGSWLQVGR